MKKTLSPFIPLVRLIEISHTDFYDKVHPYRAMIPYNIYEEVTKYHYKKTLPKTILPPRIASKIIKPKLATIISNWIDRKDSTVLSSNNRYKFHPIYLKGQEKFDCATFYKKCNGQGPFVVIIRVQSKKIYGGYNPIGFASRKGLWLLSTDSFIFSFENDQDTNDMKIGRVINSKISIYENCDNFFFSFGLHLYINGQDLLLRNYGNYNDIFKIDMNGSFQLPIEEIEVFSIVKK